MTNVATNHPQQSTSERDMLNQLVGQMQLRIDQLEVQLLRLKDLEEPAKKWSLLTVWRDDLADYLIDKAGNQVKFSVAGERDEFIPCSNFAARGFKFDLIEIRDGQPVYSVTRS